MRPELRENKRDRAFPQFEKNGNALNPRQTRLTFFAKNRPGRTSPKPRLNAGHVWSLLSRARVSAGRHVQR
ncbi:hypothetical protein ELI24_22905 [Rhizobium ruizarguesonis]|nr:hypothetical protein ELI39_22175 [Rhizobium ruizarguesonis]TAW01038.1 hypothetical protein ELI24_22905 [Rhizobium ruizarguesonis]TAW18482.1 hypothetical protein ELI25_23130 [Rhizobium ruizarguesonis]TAY23831.1 hypothetical protein ELH92_22445 [Rhizobium ruizarguesonis]TAZ54008.1 hypothetical protein ELH76_24050 [Rhizobium ruizarguesonis]